MSFTAPGKAAAQIFVAVLGASSFTYAQATWTLRGDRRRAGAAGMRHRMPRPDEVAASVLLPELGRLMV